MCDVGIKYAEGFEIHLTKLVGISYNFYELPTILVTYSKYLIHNYILHLYYDGMFNSKLNSKL